jgi:hypothetical protein
MEVLAGAMNVTKDQMMTQLAGMNFLKVPASVADTAKAAVLIASDRGRFVRFRAIGISHRLGLRARQLAIHAK